MAKPALGRGLGALLGGASPIAKPEPPAAEPSNDKTTTTTLAASSGSSDPDERERVQRVPLARLHPCPQQPRKEFTPDALQELADSIKAQGIIQPLIVRVRPEPQPAGKDDHSASDPDNRSADIHYELIAGERRWRAAQKLDLSEVPVIVREADDRAVLELALIENLQRENLNPLEEAQGYSELIDSFQLRQEDVAVKVGKSRTTVANALRLLNLPEKIQANLREGVLSVGHAKVLLGLTTPAQQNEAAEHVLKNRLSVRQTEEFVELCQRRNKVPQTTMGGTSRKAAPPLRDVHVADLEAKLREKLGTKVQLRYRQGKGAIDIRFFSEAELERLLRIFGVSAE